MFPLFIAFKGDRETSTHDISHPRMAIAPPPPPLPNPLEEHPGHYEEAVNESVAWPVVMRHILDPFNRAWETLDRQPANRLCNCRTQPCQACQGSASP